MHAQSVNTAVTLASVWLSSGACRGTDKGRRKVLPRGFLTGGIGKVLGPQSLDTYLAASNRDERPRVLVGRIGGKILQ